MAITLKNAENALKSVYLDVVTEQLDNISPFYAAIKKSTEFVSGKEARKLVVNGFKGGVGVGTEDGSLPTAGGNKYSQLVTELKNLYGTIEISDKAVRAASTDTGAFVNLLNAEMEGLIKSSSINFQRMLFGDGTGKVGMVVSKSSGNEVSVDNINNFHVGMVVEFRDSNGELCEEEGYHRVVENVDFANGCITLSGTTTENIPTASRIYLVGSFEKEITGLGKIFSDNFDTIYGLKKSENPWLNPYSISLSGAISELDMQKAIDIIEARSGSTPNLIVTTWGIRRALQLLYSSSVSRTDTVEIEGGFKAITFNGIPVVVDRFCPVGHMYLLNTNDFELHQLCDWQWLEGDDGSILKQIPGKPVYTATLVKYADLMCSRPNAQGVITDIFEA